MSCAETDARNSRAFNHPASRRTQLSDEQARGRAEHKARSFEYTAALR
jgi:hypothetical protein